MKKHEIEACSRWGATDAYREHEQKTKNYTKETWAEANDGLMAIFASCNRKTNIITVNVAAVDFSFHQNEPLHIEYFLLHEIRHIFQHMEIDDYKKDPERCVSLLELLMS